MRFSPLLLLAAPTQGCVSYGSLIQVCSSTQPSRPGEVAFWFGSSDCWNLDAPGTFHAKLPSGVKQTGKFNTWKCTSGSKPYTGSKGKDWVDSIRSTWSDYVDKDADVTCYTDKEVGGVKPPGESYELYQSKVLQDDDKGGCRDWYHRNRHVQSWYRMVIKEAVTGEYEVWKVGSMSRQLMLGRNRAGEGSDPCVMDSNRHFTLRVSVSKPGQSCAPFVEDIANAKVPTSCYIDPKCHYKNGKDGDIKSKSECTAAEAEGCYWSTEINKNRGGGCNSPLPISNGYLCDVDCPEESGFHGTGQLSCENGDWRNTYQCTKATCKATAPSTFKGQGYVTGEACGARTAVGTMCTPVCQKDDEGYWVSSIAQVTCEANGQWSGEGTCLHPGSDVEPERPQDVEIHRADKAGLQFAVTWSKPVKGEKSSAVEYYKVNVASGKATFKMDADKDGNVIWRNAEPPAGGLFYTVANAEAAYDVSISVEACGNNKCSPSMSVTLAAENYFRLTQGKVDVKQDAGKLTSSPTIEIKGDCTVLNVFGSGQTGGLNSLSDLTAAGWTHSVRHPNHGSYKRGPGFFQFFTGGSEIGWIEKAIPGAGGTLKVWYGRDCCGNTKLRVGGAVVDTLWHNAVDHLWTGPYQEGDTVRVEDHSVNVALISKVEYCAGGPSKSPAVTTEWKVLNEFGSGKVGGLNSLADLTANGWTHSVRHPNHGSYAKGPNFFQFFTGGHAVGWIEHVIPGEGGQVRVEYGRDCCGTSKLLVGGKVVDSLNYNKKSEIYVGPYKKGDTVRLEDHGVNVVLIHKVEYKEGNAPTATGPEVCNVLNVFGSGQVGGLNSLADLQAAGWSASVRHPNHGSYKRGPGFFQFFTGGSEVGWIEHALPGKGGTVKVTYGRDCCGTTKLKIGGKVVDQLSYNKVDHLWTGTYKEGETVRIEDHGVNVALISKVEYCTVGGNTHVTKLPYDARDALCQAEFGPKCMAASILNLNEHQRMSSVLRGEFGSSGGSKRVWLGGTRSDETGNWEWAEGQPMRGYENWDGIEGKNGAGQPYMCVAWADGGNMRAKWHDCHGNSEDYNVMCKCEFDGPFEDPTAKKNTCVKILESNMAAETVVGDFASGTEAKANGNWRIGKTGAQLKKDGFNMLRLSTTGLPTYETSHTVDLTALDNTCNTCNCPGNDLGNGYYWHGGKGKCYSGAHFGLSTSNDIHVHCANDGKSAGGGARMMDMAHYERNSWHGHFHRWGVNTGVYTWGRGNDDCVGEAEWSRKIQVYACKAEEGSAGVSGDPFVVDQHGAKVQFFLPLHEEIMLLSCNNNVQLFGSAFDSGIEGDHQQWFDKFRVVLSGWESEDEKAGDAALVVSIKRNATQVEDNADISAAGPKANDMLTTLTVEVDGSQMTKSGALQAESGGLVAVWHTEASETVQYSMGNMVLQIKSAVAQKFNSKQEQMLYTHLDLRFVELKTADCTAGILAEIWGIASMSQGTAAMLQPPGH